MKNHVVGSSIAAIALVCVFSLIWVSIPAAQNFGPNQAAVAKAESASTPRMSDGHPSLTGFWAGGGQGEDGTPEAPADEAGGAGDSFSRSGIHEITRTQDGSIFFSYAGANGGTEVGDDGYAVHPQTNAPYRPEYLAKVKQILSVQYGRTNVNDPNDRCTPAGVPRAGFGGFVVSSPEAVAVMYEASPGPYYRIVYTDGRGHPKDWDTSYMGHSVGHWDGDTLVVDTIALDDTTWLAGAGDSIHSDKEHVVEKWTRKGNSVTVDTTVEDPVMFTKPWVMNTRHVLLNTGNPDTYGNTIIPSMCNTNDGGHWVVTDKYVCNWCNKGSVYGEQGAAADQYTVPEDCRTAKGDQSPCQPKTGGAMRNALPANQPAKNGNAPAAQTPTRQ
jgi:hypothetical protein